MTCTQPLLAESDNSSISSDNALLVQSASSFEENEALLAGLLYLTPDGEDIPRPQNFTPSSAQPDDSSPGLLYMPSDPVSEPVVQNIKPLPSQPDDSSPGLLYIPSDPVGEPVTHNVKPQPLQPDDSKPGLFDLSSHSNSISHRDFASPPPRRGSISGGFLYWFAKQNGLDYTNRSQSTFTTSDFTHSSLVEPDFKWKPGFELAADYGFDRSFWSCGLNFIYYRGMAEGHKTAKDNEGMFPVLSFSDSTLPSDYVTSAETNWTLNTTILDADLNYEWKCSSWFSLVPYLALRNAWIHEKVRTEYEGGTFNAGSDVVRLKSHYFGIGPLIGLMPKFFFGRCCYLYGEASASYLWGSFDVRQKEAFLSTTTATLKRDVSGNRWNGNFSGGLVLKWERGFWGIKHIDLDLGADYLFFTRQYEFEHGSQFSLPKRDRTLKLYGIHISLGAHF